MYDPRTCHRSIHLCETATAKLSRTELYCASNSIDIAQETGQEECLNLAWVLIRIDHEINEVQSVKPETVSESMPSKLSFCIAAENFKIQVAESLPKSVKA